MRDRTTSRPHWYWLLLSFIVGLVVMTCLSGCNNPNYRPHRDDPYSIQNEHWMDRRVWMDPQEAEDWSYYKATHEPKSLGDYFFR